MLDQKYYTSEAAEILDVPIRTIKGWYERNLITFAGRDTGLPGYPYLIKPVELLRLAVSLEVQRLFREELGAKWNPGPFLKVFRSTVPDETLQQPPEGARRQFGASKSKSDDMLRRECDEEAKRRPNDLLIALRRLPVRTRQQPETTYAYRLQAFQESINVFLVQDVAWLLVNVSNVARRLQERIDELKKAGRRF